MKLMTCLVMSRSAESQQAWGQRDLPARQRETCLGSSNEGDQSQVFSRDEMGSKARGGARANSRGVRLPFGCVGFYLEGANMVKI